MLCCLDCGGCVLCSVDLCGGLTAAGVDASPLVLSIYKCVLLEMRAQKRGTVLVASLCQVMFSESRLACALHIADPE